MYFIKNYIICVNIFYLLLRSFDTVLHDSYIFQAQNY